MIMVLKIICATIIICYLIRYVCIWNCHQLDYKLQVRKNGEQSPFAIRPYYHSNPSSIRDPYWGYIVMNTKNNEPYTGVGDTTNFTVYVLKKDAEERLKELNEIYGYEKSA